MTKATKERDELRSLLPDMMMKIEDTRVEKVGIDCLATAILVRPRDEH